MNLVEKNAIIEIQKKRKKIVDTLQDPAAVGIWDSIVGKYSDTAHFIYEILQNADDAGASLASFELKEKELIFRHNGSRHFSVSDPSEEEKDKKEGTLGDINAITAIGLSNKIDEAKIGKFGMGFKSVFQYTNTPRIYDPEIRFKIENYMIPVLLEDDYIGRDKKETVFVFPFNRTETKPNEAHEDISGKLKNLVMPVLFLHNLTEIRFNIQSETGVFKKEILEKRDFEGTEAVKYRIINGKETKEDYIWLFSRVSQSNHRYSVGFFVDDKNGSIIYPKNYYAFCFFPTKVNTNLKFIVHAPFLLTDSREGIKATDVHNKNMVKLLAKLSADSLEFLNIISNEINAYYIKDNMLTIIPFNQNLFAELDDRENISFMPFFDEIQKKICKGLVPTHSGHTSKNHAYWSDTVDMADLFSDEQLSFLLGKEAHWGFCSYGRNTVGHNAEEGLRDYIDSVTADFYTEDKLFKLITKDFIEEQETEWLFKFYGFINSVQKRIDKIRFTPIFLTDQNKAISAYKNWSLPSLFFPDDDSKGYDTVRSDIYENEEGRKLLETLGIKTPDLKDKIFNKILKKEELNPHSDLRAFLNYYILLVENDDTDYSFIDSIESRAFLSAISEDGTQQDVRKIEDIYYPTEDLRKYYKGKNNYWFLDIEGYRKYLKKKEIKYFDDFLDELGIAREVVITVDEITQSEAEKTDKKHWDYSSRTPKWYEYSLDNQEYVMDRIIDNEDFELSVILWNQLVNQFNRLRPIKGEYSFFYRIERSMPFVCSSEVSLQTRPWILNKNGKFVSAKELTVQHLSMEYDVVSDKAKRLVSFLGIQDNHPEYENLESGLRTKLEKYDALSQLGILDMDEDELRKAIGEWNRKKKDIFYASNEEHESKQESGYQKVINDLQQREQKNVDRSETVVFQTTETSQLKDEDEFTKVAVNYKKKIEQTKQKCENEIAKIAVLEEAQECAIKSPKYSYAWFSSILELEAVANGEDNVNSREVLINFSKVERESGTIRTIILKHPSNYIPQVVEELVDIPLILIMDDGQKKLLVIENANVQSYTLKAKIKNADQLKGIDLEKVTEARIDAKNPSFLLRELQRQFAKFATDSKFAFSPEYDMQMNLCDNIKFVFGPPGTGKTTYLAENEIIPLVKKNKKLKMIVLTPTNKAADVLVERIIHMMGEDHSYENWLVRYGVTGNEKIEESPVFHSKDMDPDDFEKCVVVTTMVRFPYDYFMGTDRKFLHGINWDYIVVDEASMIPLIQMVYILYLKTPKQFIIAGDPFQIEPTTSVDLWKNENIYTMVHLDKFIDAQTMPHSYEVEQLTTQYRSVASIGEVFSQLTYDGVLNHARTDEDAKPLNIEKYLEYENLNVIKFPVSKYESIYRAKRLKYSNYQAYAALFTYEFVSYIASALATENEGVEFRIGIISPYGAQAGLIDRLIASAKIPESIKVTSGTIHGFQGDECDIIIAVFNPPPSISTSEQMFLNHQNIVNVAISRARDYLFVLMPDDETEKVDNLYLIKKLEKLIKKSFYTEYHSHRLEEVIFDNSNFLEENAFSTGHQFVNVYGEPEMKYEIRSEDTAVDIQVHNNIKN